MKWILLAAMLAVASMSMAGQARAQLPSPECTAEKKKEMRVELDGIEALRKVGIGGVSLNALRGV